RAACRTPRLDAAWHTVVGRLSARRLVDGGGQWHRGPDDAVSRNGRSLPAQWRNERRDVVFERHVGDDEPGGDDADGRFGPGSSLYVRPRDVGRLHAPGQPGVGDAGTRW